MTGITEADLLAIFRAKVGKGAGKTPVKAFAIDAGVSGPVVYRSLSGETPISDRIAEALGYRRVISVAIIPITNPSDERPDRGGCNGRINGPGRPVSIEGGSNA